MPISDFEIADFERRGFKQLFEDQFRPMKPRHFPPELERYTIPPICNQLIDQTKTPFYLLGWHITDEEFVTRYGPRCDGWSDLWNLLDKLCDLWAAEHEIYRRFKPHLSLQNLDGDYFLSVIDNSGENYLRQSLDDDFVKAAMDFLGYRDPPKWIRA